MSKQNSNQSSQIDFTSKEDTESKTPMSVDISCLGHADIWAYEAFHAVVGFGIMWLEHLTEDERKTYFDTLTGINELSNKLHAVCSSLSEEEVTAPFDMGTEAEEYAQELIAFQATYGFFGGFTGWTEQFLDSIKGKSPEVIDVFPLIADSTKEGNNEKY